METSKTETKLNQAVISSDDATTSTVSATEGGFLVYSDAPGNSTDINGGRDTPAT